MLRKIKILRFKSIKKLELDFGRINLFIGGNGTGKTNLLEAIGLMSACLGRGLSDSDIGSKGLRITPPELMKSAFKNGSLPNTLELHGDFENDIEYRVVLRSREFDSLLSFYSEVIDRNETRLFTRSKYEDRRLDPSRGIWDHIKAFGDIQTEVINAFSDISRYVIYTPQTDFLRGKQTGRIDEPPVGLRGEGMPGAVSSFLATLRV